MYVPQNDGGDEHAHHLQDEEVGLPHDGYQEGVALPGQSPLDQKMGEHPIGDFKEDKQAQKVLRVPLLKLVKPILEEKVGEVKEKRLENG